MLYSLRTDMVYSLRTENGTVYSLRGLDSMACRPLPTLLFYDYSMINVRIEVRAPDYSSFDSEP